MAAQQGQSASTVDKERHIATALAIGIRIANCSAAKHKWKDFKFWHFDANCGSGWNKEVNVPGSPIVFHQMADSYLTRMKREAFFCDHNEEHMRELKTRLSVNPLHDQNSYLLPGDNKSALKVFAKHVAKYENKNHALGCVIVDPNGYWYRNKKGEGVPTEYMEEFAKHFPKIDIVLNINVQFYWRARAHKVWKDKSLPSPEEVLRSLNKTNWLIRRTSHSGHTFLLAIGRNTHTESQDGMVRLESREGRDLISELNNFKETTDERQPLLNLPTVSTAPTVQDNTRNSPSQSPL